MRELNSNEVDHVSGAHGITYEWVSSHQGSVFTFAPVQNDTLPSETDFGDESFVPGEVVPGVVAGPGVPLFREDGSVEDNPIFC